MARLEYPDHLLAGMERLQRRVNRSLGERLGDAVPGLRGSFARTLGVLPADGARPGDLAEGTSITKQSMSERVAEMQRLGWVGVTADPDDGRARLVRRTPEGDRVRDLTERAIAGLEADLAAEVGEERYQTFIAVLAELGRAVDFGPEPNDAPTS